MKPSPFNRILVISLAIFAISSCSQNRLTTTVSKKTPQVSYNHTQRNKINKQKYINQYQQAYIRTVNKSKRHSGTSSKRRASPATTRFAQQAKRPSLQVARYNPAKQQARFKQAGYNPTTTLRNTWGQVHRGYKMGNFNHQPKVRRFIKSYARMPKRMESLSHRSTPYLPLILNELKRRNMPTEIALLPFVESAYNNHAYSPAHAAGLWQFIPGTARRYGLPVSKRYDARYNFKASTNAALSYLQDLNRQFNGDWLLSLAAYNCGEARVHREIAKNRKRGLPTDFWHLRLPKETRNYVPRLLAFKEVYGNPKAYGIHVAHIPSNPLYGRVSLSKYTKATRKSYKKSKKKTYHKIVTHKVRSGDTLFRIAKKYRTSVNKIMRMNGLKSTKIKAGKRLKVAITKRRRYG